MTRDRDLAHRARLRPVRRWDEDDGGEGSGHPEVSRQTVVARPPEHASPRMVVGWREPAATGAAEGLPRPTRPQPRLTPALRSDVGTNGAVARIRSGLHGLEEEPAPWPPLPPRAEGVPPHTGVAEAGPGANGARGLSVGEAAAASPIAFRPVSDMAIRPRFRAGYQPVDPDLAHDTSPAQAGPALARPTASEGVPRDLHPPAPGAPAPPPGRRATPEEAAETPSRRRFVRTVAELRRQQEQDGAHEPWGAMVLRPAAARRNEQRGREDEPSRSKLGALWRYLTGR